LSRLGCIIQRSKTAAAMSVWVRVVQQKCDRGCVTHFCRKGQSVPVSSSLGRGCRFVYSQEMFRIRSEPEEGSNVQGFEVVRCRFPSMAEQPEKVQPILEQWFDEQESIK